MPLPYSQLTLCIYVIPLILATKSEPLTCFIFSLRIQQEFDVLDDFFSCKTYREIIMSRDNPGSGISVFSKSF